MSYLICCVLKTTNSYCSVDIVDGRKITDYTELCTCHIFTFYSSSLQHILRPSCSEAKAPSAGRRGASSLAQILQFHGYARNIRNRRKGTGGYEGEGEVCARGEGCEQEFQGRAGIGRKA